MDTLAVHFVRKKVKSKGTQREIHIAVADLSTCELFISPEVHILRDPEDAYDVFMNLKERLKEDSLWLDLKKEYRIQSTNPNSGAHGDTYMQYRNDCPYASHTLQAFKKIIKPSPSTKQLNKIPPVAKVREPFLNALELAELWEKKRGNMHKAHLWMIMFHLTSGTKQLDTKLRNLWKAINNLDKSARLKKEEKELCEAFLKKVGR